MYYYEPELFNNTQVIIKNNQHAKPILKIGKQTQQGTTQTSNAKHLNANNQPIITTK